MASVYVLYFLKLAFLIELVNEVVVSDPYTNPSLSARL